MNEREQSRAGLVGAIMVPHPPLIIPEVGRGEEAGIAATIAAYRKAAEFAVSLHPDTYIISSPHSIMYADYFHISPGRGAKGDFGRFRAPSVAISAVYDEKLRDEICRLADKGRFPAGDLGEKDPSLDHATLIPLYFLQQAGGSDRSFTILRIGLSGLPLPMHYELGQMVNEAAKALGRRIVWIASGDLSHKLTDDGPYGYSPDGPVYDSRIMKTMGAASFGDLFDYREPFLESAAECGHRSFVEMAGALDGLAVEAKALSHEGPFGVGYGVCTYRVTGEDASRHFLAVHEKAADSALARKRATEDPYVQLARASVEAYVKGKEVVDADTAADRLPCGALPDDLLNRRAGAFVSIHENGRLRGCIGTIAPVQERLADEIILNAISASTRDPRFAPIRPEELSALDISVDVLSEAEPIASKAELDVKRYGVIVTKGAKRGLLLPDLDGVASVEQQIAIAKQKAGIDVDDAAVSLQRFEVVRHV